MAVGGRPRPRIGRLPADLTNFVGRRQDVAQVKRLLTVARLVTLTGVGGTGKTRLATNVAGEIRRGFADGVWLVDLVAVSDPGLVGYAVAETLGVRDDSGRDVAAMIVEHLRDRELLLVLDNCEHVLDGCAQLVDVLLRSAPGLRVLCTSRQPLGTISEHIQPVPPLPVPGANRSRSGAATLSGYPSVVLFAERAAAASPGFAVTPENQERIAEICRRLDGLPLAIELAAAQLRALSIDQLDARLRDRLPALRTRHAIPPHHRTLEAMFDWSFELCSPAEQKVWNMLSVFVDGVDLAAAEYVCGAGSTLLPEVSGLVDKSVLLRDGVVDGTRYRLLETVRQYGLSRLRAGSGDEHVLRGRHRDWYVQLVERFAADWFGPRQEEWATLIRREQPNLRAALEFSLGPGNDPSTALRIAAGLEAHWLSGGFPQEGRYWLDRVLAANPRPSAIRAAGLSALARVLNALADDDAVAVAEEGLAAARELGVPALIGRATGDLGVCLLVADADPPLALTTLERSQEQLADADQVTLVVTRLSLAMARLYTGDVAGAAQLTTRTAQLCRDRGERWWLSIALIATAQVALSRGDPAAADRALREGLELISAIRDAASAARMLDLMCASASMRGRYERAAMLFGAATTMWRCVTHETFGTGALRARRERAQAAAREALGAAFEAVYAAGCALSFEDALSFARGATPSDPDVPAEPGPPPDALTKREWEVAGLVADGLSNKQIAVRLAVAQRTAESHVENILRKLDFNSRAQIAAWYADRMRQPGG